VVPPERLVSTEAYDEPWYEGEATSMIVLVEQDGKTTLTTTVRYASQTVRDGVLKAGMTQGFAAGLDRMAELLASLQVG